MRVSHFSKQRATFNIDVLIRPESLEKVYDIAGQYVYDAYRMDMSFKESRWLCQADQLREFLLLLMKAKKLRTNIRKKTNQ